MAWLEEQQIFWREFRQNFKTTGAIMPSGGRLAKALSRFVGESGPPRRILEVGPGTGAVTKQIVARLRPDDRLDLVELNDSFVAQLHRRFESEAAFRQVAPQTQILHQSVETLPADQPYDLIISGLPLNNFEVPLVERILAALDRLLLPHGKLSFFEYVAIRKAKSWVSGGAERQRLNGISRQLGSLLKQREIYRDLVLLNAPPAWVHHVQGVSHA
jgi:phospholipid N-methyltransferase